MAALGNILITCIPTPAGTVTSKYRDGIDPGDPDPDPEPAGKILWNGDFSTGNFTQWPNNDETLTNVGMLFCPPAGAPPSTNLPAGNTYSYRNGSWTMDGEAYSWSGTEGDGTNLNLVRTSTASVGAYAIGNTRGSSEYAAKFVVKANPLYGTGTGLEPRDGDIPTLDLGRRRSELQCISPIALRYSPLVHLKTRWYSLSIFNPSNQPSVTSQQWGPSHYAIRKIQQRPGGVLNIKRDPDSNGWEITTDHGDATSYTVASPLSQWYETCSYTPATGVTEYSELIPDFPNATNSRAALSNANIGGWTDFVIKVTFDYRVPSAGGVGQLDVWMRAGSSLAIDAAPVPGWVHVIQQLPKVLVRSARYTINRGIGFNFVGGNNGGGVGVYAGNYMGAEGVWTAMDKDFVTHIANCKVGDETCTFADLSPDGSTA